VSGSGPVVVEASEGDSLELGPYSIAPGPELAGGEGNTCTDLEAE